jgi:TolB-like protein
VGAVVFGSIAAVGHFVGGMIGWWHAYEITFGARKTAPQPASRATLPVKLPSLSIVVLPLINESDNKAEDWFIDGLSADLTTELGQVSGSFVISRDSAFTYKGKAADARDVARELGVRYVVRGSARRNGDRVRLNLSMVDGESGSQRWAQQLDVERGQLAVSLDAIGRQMARSLSVQLYRSAGQRSAAMNPDQVQADDLALQGWDVYFRGLTRENFQEALRLFEQAVAKDPKSIRGWGGVAVINGFGAAIDWMPDRDAAVRRLEFAAARLQDLDADDLFAFLAKSSVANIKGDYEGHLLNAITMAERFPSHPQPHYIRALASMNLGRFEECIEPTKYAISLSPRDSLLGIWNWQIATCYFMRGEYKEAADFARIAQQVNPKLPLPPLTLAASLARDGHRDEAQQIVADYVKRNPGYEVANIQKLMRSPNPKYAEGRNRLLETLRDLGMR